MIARNSWYEAIGGETDNVTVRHQIVSETDVRMF